MGEQERSVKFFFDGEEVSQRRYLYLKFCLCGLLNEPGRLMCKHCKKNRAELLKRIDAHG